MIDGREDVKPLSQLFDSQKPKEAYDEDLLFTWKALLDERGGPTLRNEIEHDRFAALILHFVFADI